jgi:hypothetical protein
MNYKNQEILYFIKVDNYGHCHEYYHVSDDLETVAEGYVKDEYDYGGDLDERIDLEIFDAGLNSLGVFTVYKTCKIEYSAYEKRVK